MERNMPTGVAILGCGTVGSAVAEMLLNEKLLLKKRAGRSFDLRHILVRDSARPRPGIPRRLLTTDAAKILHDPQAHIVVELMGRIEPAGTLIRQALYLGKRVVTANKHLLALHGVDVFRAARKAGSSVCFEASCGGAIPIVMALSRGLVANDIDRIIGIVNGTCNYILTRMSDGQTYAQALAEAQSAGFAEPDPTMDVRGTDSAHKLAILAALAFGVQVPFEKIQIQGIDSLDAVDLNYGRELGYVCKLLAIAEKINGYLSLRVHPAFVPRQHLLASVGGPFNAISVFGHASGQTLYYGRGAGGRPTASAVVADIVDSAMGTADVLFRELPALAGRSPARIMPPSAVVCRHYLRMQALDQPGSMHRITGVLGKKGISLAAVAQHESRQDSYVPLVVMTHEAGDGAVTAALRVLNRLNCVRGKVSHIRVIDPAQAV